MSAIGCGLPVRGRASPCTSSRATAARRRGGRAVGDDSSGRPRARAMGRANRPRRRSRRAAPARRWSRAARLVGVAVRVPGHDDERSAGRRRSRSLVRARPRSTVDVGVEGSQVDTDAPRRRSRRRSSAGAVELDHVGAAERRGSSPRSPSTRSAAAGGGSSPSVGRGPAEPLRAGASAGRPAPCARSGHALAGRRPARSSVEDTGRRPRRRRRRRTPPRARRSRPIRGSRGRHRPRALGRRERGCRRPAGAAHVEGVGDHGAGERELVRGADRTMAGAL